MSTGGRVAVGCGTAVAIVVVLLATFLVWFGSSFKGLGDPEAGDVCAHSDVPLVRASGLGDVTEVTRQLDAGEDINRADRDANTALGCAIPRGRLAVVQLLLRRGADPNRDTGRGQFMEDPLNLAIRNRGEAEIEPLMKAGADTNRVDCKGSPLEAALGLPDRALAARLIGSGADPNGRVDGTPPLLLAARAGDVATVRLLLDNGADPNGRPGGRPVIRAASRGDSTVLDLLLSHGASLDVQTGGISTSRVIDDALDLAASNGHVEMVNRLLDAGADPNHDPHLSPLLRSLYYGRTDVAAVLLDRGADPNAGTVDELTLFAITSGLDSLPVTTSTTPGAAGTSPPSPPRSKPLMDLLRRDAPSLAPNLYSTSGTTPGTNTSTTQPADPRLADCKDLFKVLDELSDAEGLLALTRAPGFHRYDVPPLAIAMLTQSDDNVRILLDHGADPNRLTLTSYPLLYLAGVDCNVDAARALLDHGADPTPIRPGFVPAPPNADTAGRSAAGTTGTTMGPAPSVCTAVGALGP